MVSNAVFNTISLGMRYWFLIISGIMLLMIVVISKREYKERQAALGEIRYYIGYLEILGGMPKEDVGVRIGITADNTVGSGRSSDIVIVSPSVERSHALIYRQGNKVMISPLSRGETKINGRRAVKNHQIKSGDVIEFGKVGLRVFLREEVDT